MEKAVGNLETYHRQLCPLHGYGGMVQDNK